MVEESITKEASVIVAYHPTIFGALKSFTMANPLQASLLRCAAHGISVYCPHTALDCTWGGINDWLAEGIMGGNQAPGTVRPLQVEKFSPSGDSEGAVGRLVALQTPVTMGVLEKRVKEHLKLSQSELSTIPLIMRFVMMCVQVQVGYASTRDRLRSSAIVETIAICAGSGGSVFAGKKADVYFTGEMQHVGFLFFFFLYAWYSISSHKQHEVLAAVAAGTNVILCE